jgi:hypothetical protein
MIELVNSRTGGQHNSSVTEPSNNMNDTKDVVLNIRTSNPVEVLRNSSVTPLVLASVAVPVHVLFPLHHSLRERMPKEPKLGENLPHDWSFVPLPIPPKLVVTQSSVSKSKSEAECANRAESPPQA